MALQDSDPRKSEATLLIQQLRDGDSAVSAKLLPLVYDELRALAQSFFDRQRPDHTLQPTALVHEAFVRLGGNADRQWEGSAHFFAVAAKAMRHVLADHARAHRAAKRGGGVCRQITLSGIGEDNGDAAALAIDVDDALHELAELSERQAKVVELRFFGGLTVPEVARVLEISERTAFGEWRLARAWLRRRLEAGEVQ